MSNETRKVIGANGAQIKEEITEAKRQSKVKTEGWDFGAATLGTDNEVGSAPDHEGMKEALKAPAPK